MIETKYQSIETSSLILAIQKSHLALVDKKWKEKMSAKRFKEMRIALAEMRVEVIQRLQEIDKTKKLSFQHLNTETDRTKKEFFSLGSLVTYSPGDDYPSRQGTVIRYGDLNTLIVSLEGEMHWMEVIPTNCSLLFIRNSIL